MLIVNRQDERFTKERISTCSTKEICHISTTTFIDMLWLHAYHQLQEHCAYPNYDTIPNTLEIGKWSPSLIFGYAMWILQTPTVLVLNNIVTNVPDLRNVTPNLRHNRTFYETMSTIFHVNNANKEFPIASPRFLEPIPKTNPKLSKWRPSLQWQFRMQLCLKIWHHP